MSGFIIYYEIAALCRLCLCSSLIKQIASVQSNEIGKFPSRLSVRSMIVEN